MKPKKRRAMQRAVKMKTNSQPPASATEAESNQTASDKARCASATGSASYEKCHCGADCVMLGTHKNEPCWGKVTTTDVVETDEDDIWIHHCAGHEPTQDIPPKPYKPETPNEKI